MLSEDLVVVLRGRRGCHVAWSVLRELTTAGGSRNSSDTARTSRLVNTLQFLGYLYNTATLHTPEDFDT
jgi:hypothetical protein